MKKIINGKAYDTQKAKLVGEYNDMLGSRDFHHVVEYLYRKRTGEFFLHGIGGPASKYAESAGLNAWSGGEKIIPLDYAAAQKWAEEKLTADEYEEIFGEVDENDTLTALNVRIPAGLAAWLRQQAAAEGKSLQDEVTAILEAARSQK